MDTGVIVTGLQLAVFMHYQLGGRLGGLTLDLSVSSSESLCWRVFWKSATRASLDRSCLSRSPISLLLDCSCAQTIEITNSLAYNTSQEETRQVPESDQYWYDIARSKAHSQLAICFFLILYCQFVVRIRD